MLLGAVCSALYLLWVQSAHKKQLLWTEQLLRIPPEVRELYGISANTSSRVQIRNRFSLLLLLTCFFPQTSKH